MKARARWAINVPLLFFLIPTSSAYLTDPPTTADPKTVADCSNWIVAKAEDKCDGIASQYGISASEFTSVYNPSVGSPCKLNAGQSYCVERNFGIPEAPPITAEPTAATTTTTSKASSTTGNGIVTPRPTQPGITSSCNKFYKPAKGEDCAAVLESQGVSWEDFYAWNQGVGSNCENMWADTYQCVGVIGGTTSAPTTPIAPTTTTRPPSTPTSRGNGISTPLPTMPGMTPNCDKFYKVQNGEGCWDITTKFDISSEDFYAWNTGVGSNCEKMWANAYVCVHAFQ